MSGKSVREVLSDKLLLAYRVDDVLADIRAAMPSKLEILDACVLKNREATAEAIHALVMSKLK